jgi:hypothetical protein
LLAVYFSGDHWHRAKQSAKASAVILWTGEAPQPASERIQLLRARRFGELYELIEKG